MKNSGRMVRADAAHQGTFLRVSAASTHGGVGSGSGSGCGTAGAVEAAATGAELEPPVAAGEEDPLSAGAADPPPSPVSADRRCRLRSRRCSGISTNASSARLVLLRNGPNRMSGRPAGRSRRRAHSMRVIAAGTKPSGAEISPGALVRDRVRSRRTMGVVVSGRPANDVRAADVLRGNASW